MEDTVWNNMDPRELNEATETFETFTGPTAVVNGATIPLEVGANFKQTIIGLATDAGYGKFKVYLNGNELKASAAPEDVRPGDQIRVTPFDKAA